MSLRINILGRGQGLDGDETSTGAICIANQSIGFSSGIAWLFEGDKTTDCPRCGEAGTIIEGEPCWTQNGIPTAVDGALVKCGCPLGDNRLVAPLHQGPAPRRAPPPTVVAVAPAQAYASTLERTSYHATTVQPPTMTQSQEPGFYIVPRCMTYQEILIELGAPQANLPSSILERLNPTFQQGFKAGEIFVISDGLSRPACTREELIAMSAAQQAREALADLTDEEADFMMRHQAEIAGLLSDVSLTMGVSQAMMARSLDELSNILRTIEELHQQQFAKHGHLRSPAFFAERKKLFKQLDANLKATFLNKRMNLGNYEKLRRDLGISSKSLVHHWSKAGAPGHIPGYSTHLNKLARLSKFLKAGGNVGIAIGGAGSALKIYEACQAGSSGTCRKTQFTEIGNFSVGLAGGIAGAKAGGAIAVTACWVTGPGTPVCSLVVTGIGALAGSVGGMKLGEIIGEAVYEVFDNE
ncbi:PAAR domain-containing protein [Pseudomonas putida]|uniref:PAAR domain-containing protein n=1 Tax=Pseudomonas putida TaxID=303 RepID=A0A6I6XP29_PSEPU|nr:PAAR domain-containing protein [Pseudomonas putida]QHG63160.1 PAAR domain-containing protein [Pseudomonas putida]